MISPNKPKVPGAPVKTYTFICTSAGLMALIGAAALTLSLFFLLGVLVGRGHRPESAIPPIERMMPKEQPAAAGPATEILKAEELQYSDQLAKKGTEAQPAKSIDGPERKTQEPAKTPDKAADAKKAAEAEAKAKAEAKTKAKTEAKAKAEAKTKTGDGPRYDYVYQAGSFPDENQAKAFLKRVKATGLKASIENATDDGKPLYRVVVSFRGKPVETRELKAKLGTVGVPKPLMRSKTPI